MNRRTFLTGVGTVAAISSLPKPLNFVPQGNRPMVFAGDGAGHIIARGEWERAQGGLLMKFDFKSYSSVAEVYTRRGNGEWTIHKLPADVHVISGDTLEVETRGVQLL